ncbi:MULTISPECIES: macro domain-containing protein [unclassified Nocardioides]|uniref:macro domain-containing protein n=1 Tax=unclassified Nocardioides TaxID=2615069 RepID=UPI0000EB607D|nr:MULTISPECIES: macro domain-containing protein [unclassified Nocardioides]ABL79331.1 hypothetical protein Noca_4745 [Nocardioides sp. JS614]
MNAASVGSCACSAVQGASELGFSSIAMPLIGTGNGHLSPTTSLTAIRRGLDSVFSTSGSPAVDLDVLVCTPDRPAPAA